MLVRALALLLALLASLPAAAQQVPNPLNKDAANADLPWNLTTDNDSTLNGGIKILNGYTGPITDPPGVPFFRWWGLNVQYGSQDCQAHMFNIFRPIRGFTAGIASCGTVPPDSSTTQFIPGLFSVVGGNSGSAPLALVSQAVVGPGMLPGGGAMAYNSVNQDTYVTGDSSSSTIAGTTLTVGGTVTGSFNVGDIVQGTGLKGGTYIISQLTGVAGKAGTYRINIPHTLTARVVVAKAYFFNVTVQNEYDHFCQHNDTRCRNIIDGSFPSGDQSSVYGVTVGGTVTAGDILNLTITDGTVAGSPKALSYTAIGGDTTTTAALGLAQAINDNADLTAAGYSARQVDNVVRVYYPTNNGPLQRPTVSFVQSVTGTATITLGLLVSGADARFGIGTVTFTGSVGKWQNSFQSGNGSADFALVVGTAEPFAGVLGARSQGIKFNYTDNTSAGVQRVATMFIDPAQAGATGTDLVLGNHSGQATNLRILSGDLNVAGNIISRTLLANTHIFATTVDNGNDTEISFQKARGSTTGTTNVVQVGDNLGTVRFQGYDGSAYVNAAQVTGLSTSVAAGNVGGILQILTNGAERLRVTDVGINLPTVTTTGTAAGSLCIDAVGVVFKKTTAGPCL